MQIYFDNSNSLVDLIDNIESFTIFKNGNVENLFACEKKDKIKNALFNLFKQGTLEPAFGVSLHNLTLEEIKKDCWLQINFNDQQSKNGLPFNSLLIKLEETGGFNLIRLYNSKYDGRCLYLRLEKTTDLNSVIL